jgi:transglutaminase superfamily protein
MGKKLTILLLILTVLIGLSGWYVAGGIQAYSRYQQSSIASQEHCGGQSPVHICVQAPSEIFSAYYPFYVATQSDLFTIHYSSSSPITLVVSVSITGFSQAEMHTVNSTANVQSISFMPLVINQALRQLTVDNNTWLHVSITDTPGHVYYVNDSPLLLHSRWLMQWIATNRLKIAAWVTPDDPAVIALVSKAEARLQSEPSPTPPAMVGYANRASTRAVRDEVDAIFDAMRLDYHIQYSQASVPYTGPGDNNVALQKIKLPAEVLQQRSGMCIELTALLASAVERIGLHAEIVIIPEHAFLGVAVTPDDSQFEYWDAVQVNSKVAGDSANLWADNEYKQNAKQIVDTIVISDARKQGVGPML